MGLFPLVAEPNSIDELATVRENLSQSLEYKDQANKEMADWERRTGELDNLILIAEEEKKNLEAVVAMSRPLLEELRSRQTELNINVEESKQLTDFLRSAVPPLANNLIEKTQIWPEMLLSEARDHLHQIRTLLKQDIGSLNNKDLETMIRSTVETINFALDYQSQVQRSSVLKKLPDGREAYFDIVFIGLAAAYYVSQDLQMAGTITIDNKEWVWSPNNELLEPINSFIAIVEKDRPTDWIQLPVMVSTEGLAK